MLPVFFRRHHYINDKYDKAFGTFINSSNLILFFSFKEKNCTKVQF